MPSHFTSKNIIGRSHEFEVLKRIHMEAQSGDASGIFLSGRNGIGKTELLRQTYYHLFNNQDMAIPFFYTMKTSLTSIENFSRDYFCSFIVQSIAFLKRDLTIIDACLYSLEDVLQLADESAIPWIADIAKNYQQEKKENDPLNLYLSTISLPYSSYLMSGKPVIVMFDDFHRMRKFCEINMKDGNRDFWVLFETSVKSRHTPHIFTGNQAELNRMFFEDTLFGESLELFNLPCLRPSDAEELFSLLCETYGLEIKMDISEVIGLLGGSPYYIQNFIQAARQSSGALSEENFWFIYLSEITKGKTFRYWTSILKTYIPHFDLRKTSLRFLYQLSQRDSSDILLADLPEELSVEHEQIVNLLHTSGVVDAGFSDIELADDRILSDIIKGLYLKEIEKRPWNGIRDEIISVKNEHGKQEQKPLFSLTIPADAKAQLVAVKTIEYVAGHFGISPEISGQLQLALAYLFTNVIGQIRDGSGSYILSFHLQENIFLADIEIPQQNIVLADNDQNRIRAYLDSLRIESISGGTKITLLKEIRKDAVSVL